RQTSGTTATAQARRVNGWAATPLLYLVRAKHRREYCRMWVERSSLLPKIPSPLPCVSKNKNRPVPDYPKKAAKILEATSRHQEETQTEAKPISTFPVVLCLLRR